MYTLKIYSGEGHQISPFIDFGVASMLLCVPIFYRIVDKRLFFCKKLHFSEKQCGVLRQF